jgi:hypothetical protein
VQFEAAAISGKYFEAERGIGRRNRINSKVSNFCESIGPGTGLAKKV